MTTRNGVLNAEKGVALVIKDKDMCIEKYMALLNDEKEYHECRDKIKSIHSKGVEQLLTKKTPWDQNFRLNTSNFTLLGTTTHPPDSMVYHKFLKPIYPSDL